MAEQFQHELIELRQELDAIDDQLVRLLNNRATVSLRVGELKRGAGARPYVPEREAELIERLRKSNRGPLPNEHLVSFYREILSSSRALQRAPRIAYLGPPATFSNQAALAVFGASSEYLAMAGFAEIFAAVQSGQADCGVVPVENSIEGPVQQNLDLLAEGEAQVCGEVTIPVAHFLMSSAEIPLTEITKVYSHPQTDGQCRRWLAANLPGREVVHVASNTRAAELAAAEPGTAGISPRPAAEIYDLVILAENIQDSAANFTRFFVISTRPSERPTGRDRTAICFSIRDRVGALRDVVGAFSDAGLNLSAIQSRPSKRRAWDYLFFVELDGHAADPHVAETLRRVEQHCVFLKVLGAWPVPA
jgi:chorismate mutase / prephenate dehydratase